MKQARIVDPWAFTEPTLEEARALKALAVGEATSEQQKSALKWIMHRACGLGLDTFAPGSADVTAYRSGKRSVGVKIQTVLLTKAETYRNGEKDI